MFTLSEKTKKNIESTVGKSFAEICEVNSATDFGMHVEFSRERKPLVSGRGNPYLAQLQFITLEEADEEMSCLVGEIHGRKTDRCD